ncbi:gatC [Shigella flexneri K-315]|nr:gatC [Shigella flexneri K-315]
MMSLCGERFVSSLGRSYTTPFPVSGKHYDQVYRASILTLTELKKPTNKPHCDSA